MSGKEITNLVIIGVMLFMTFGALYSERTQASSVNTTPIYSTAGVEQMADHFVIGRTTLAVGTVTITLTGKATFSSASSYHCSLTDSTGLNLTAITYISGSQFTVTRVGLSDNVSFFCGGN